ncbi:hypothetical protein [Caldalkalibacillus mannanilyticus]|uniref:hypothetical protein n=1 Tax=Caldalkalibacillus mannanilyticus TaxID=1418 RepID=UPI00131EF65D|nr:hypothetical protein [Caldalkalibacillus mannanilyticus]
MKLKQKNIALFFVLMLVLSLVPLSVMADNQRSMIKLIYFHSRKRKNCKIK